MKKYLIIPLILVQLTHSASAASAHDSKVQKLAQELLAQVERNHADRVKSIRQEYEQKLATEQRRYTQEKENITKQARAQAEKQLQEAEIRAKIQERLAAGTEVDIWEYFFAMHPDYITQEKSTYSIKKGREAEFVSQLKHGTNKMIRTLEYGTRDNGIPLYAIRYFDLPAGVTIKQDDPLTAILKNHATKYLFSPIFGTQKDNNAHWNDYLKRWKADEANEETSDDDEDQDEDEE